MKSREARFVGNGNTWVGDGHYRGWKIVCSRCDDVKVMSGHNGSSMPPSLILKRYTQAGWVIGTRPEYDLCDGCRKKPASKRSTPASMPKKTPPPPSKKAIIEFPAVGPDFLRQLQACLGIVKEALESRNYGRASRFVDAALGGVARSIAADTGNGSTISKPQPSAPAAQDDDYQSWLSQQDDAHHPQEAEYNDG
jgi:hypothetical protein